MGKRVRISNSSLNSYGTRVLTSGLDIEQYSRNPVLLYMHQRGTVIGYVKDVKVEGDDLTGELMFDGASELSERCKKQFEFGSLKMVSAAVGIKELSEDKELLVAGQTSPTITKGELLEVSVVDIGANNDALVLQRDGKTITLGRDGECPLPLLNNHNNQKTNEMEKKDIALFLGLPETATEEQINTALTELKAAKQQSDELKEKYEKLTLANITGMVTRAIGEKRLGEENKEHFIELGKKIGAEELEKTLSAMAPQVKLSAVIDNQGGAGTVGQTATYEKLSQVPADRLEAMRDSNPGEYKRLYKAEYGMECEL